ncbi:MAG: NarK/NasA family nitrate transporter [Calditrichaeota bacterium]|nr:NarK/NasA family nitrate transporter [Calditrichota bacterium]MCB9367484.1 NarK/NasA family nitrate transporter [Calditrichota bacterium]
MGHSLTNWNVEDNVFWESEGKRIANRNLWISIPCLLCGFAVWMYWSIVTTKMQELGFVFDPDPAKNKAMLYTMISIAGLTGATLRIPNSFFVALSGGRNVIVATTALLILPAIGLGLALREPGTSYSTFVVLSALSGIGGGAFASSMSNISIFFPKRVQGTALGLNAGLGNLGVSVMQVLLPFTMTFGMFGAFGGGAYSMPTTGASVWIQNSGFVWVPILLVLTILAWFLMNNMATHNVGSAPAAIGKMLYLTTLGFASAAVGLYLLISLKVNMWIVLPITILLTLALIRYLSPEKIRTNLKKQYAIFGEKHNWVMTWLYVMTFGSFIGYSAAFPKLIQDVFGYLPDGSINSNAPNPFAYAWLGPLVGSLIRPVGGWLSDKFGGARVTHWDTIVMIAAALGVAYNVKAANDAPNPEVYFFPFLILFLLLFVTTGIGNGSTFRMIPMIFEPHQAGPVLGWTSAVAAYGAFIIPKVFGAQIQAGHPEYALYGFAVYYGSCLLVNWWFYARRNAEIKC